MGRGGKLFMILCSKMLSRSQALPPPTHESLGMRLLQSLPAVAMPTSCKLLKACKTYITISGDDHLACACMSG